MGSPSQGLSEIAAGIFSVPIWYPKDFFQKSQQRFQRVSEEFKGYFRRVLWRFSDDLQHSDATQNFSFDEKFFFSAGWELNSHSEANVMPKRLPSLN